MVARTARQKQKENAPGYQPKLVHVDSLNSSRPQSTTKTGFRALPRSHQNPTNFRNVGTLSEMNRSAQARRPPWPSIYFDLIFD